VQTDSYYPFGLTFNSWEREGSTANKLNLFQGQERIEALGLGWDAFKWRNHQPDIGRFFNIDPIAEDYYYNSPYAFSENKVTGHIELEGLEAVEFPNPGQQIADGFNEFATASEKFFRNYYNAGLELLGFTEADDASVLLTGRHINGSKATNVGIGLAAAGIFAPISGKTLKKAFRNADKFDDAIEASGKSSNIVYRALREGEDISKGLRARSPGSNTKVSSHVIKVNSEIIDASSGVGKGRVHSRTKSHKEVFIRDTGGNSPAISPEAIKKIE